MSPPVITSASSATVRPAAQGANHRVDPALLRIAVNGLCGQQAALGKPMRRSEARRAILEQIASGEIPFSLLNSLGLPDPTGEKATAKVDRDRGVRHG